MSATPKPKKIGLLGGSFDPVHYGHLAIAQAAQNTFELDSVVFIPALVPPHKLGRQLAPPEDRLQMVSEAVAAYPSFKVSTIELERSGRSYTYDTITQLQQQNSVDEFFFIIGADSLHDIHSWYKADSLLTLCKFIVAVRPGYDLGEIIAHDRFLHRYAAQILPLYMPMWPISSTEIRKKLLSGTDVTDLIPPGVINYIKNHNLYMMENNRG